MQKTVWLIVKRILLAALIFALVGGLCWITPIALFYVSSISYFDADYKSYAGEFDLVAEYVLSLCPNPEERRIIDLHWDRETHTVALHEDGEALPLPEDVSEALNRLADTTDGAFLQKASLYFLRVEAGRIEFCTEQPYELVYSPSGRPRGEAFEDAEHIKHIKGAWYHVRFF